VRARRLLGLFVVVAPIGACSLTALDGFSGGDAADAASDGPPNADAGVDADAAPIEAGPAPDANVGPPTIARLVLVDVGGKPIAGFDPIKEGMKLPLSMLPPATIEAIASPAVVGSVRFKVTGTASFEEMQNTRPYTVNDSTGGTYEPWRPAAGPYQLSVTAYPLANFGGTAGPPLSVNIVVE
jgi:hypothetical protein